MQTSIAKTCPNIEIVSKVIYHNGIPLFTKSFTLIIFIHISSRDFTLLTVVRNFGGGLFMKQVRFIPLIT